MYLRIEFLVDENWNYSKNKVLEVLITTNNIDKSAQG